VAEATSYQMNLAQAHEIESLCRFLLAKEQMPSGKLELTGPLQQAL
jgi:hypothetical protein